MVENCSVVITDSGEITEETTVMGIPCITFRDNSERPETTDLGTNELIGTNPSAVLRWKNSSPAIGRKAAFQSFGMVEQPSALSKIC